MVVFTNLTVALQSKPDRIVIAYIGFLKHQNNKKLKTQISLKISTKNWTKALMPLLSAPLAVLLMVVAHVLARIMELVISVVIPISKEVVFTNLIVAL